MKTISLRPAKQQRDFAELASLFTLEQDEPTSEASLHADYEKHKERIFCLTAAEDEKGNLSGFNWATRSRLDSSEAYFYVIVKPEHRRRGAGGKLYADLEQAARQQAGIKKLKVAVRDSEPDFRAFAERRGFTLNRHSLAMKLDLEAFADQPYDKVIDNLKSEGFQFTTMEALGNTEEAQRKLYALNDATSAETPGSEGVHSWLSFEDFQKEVCQSDWYKPDGQMVAIDSASGEWVAMSAITRFEGCDYAYNLFTGVDKRYRGRKLAQAVKVLALRYAREKLNVKSVQTNHNSVNAPMLAVDRKFGYVQIPGILYMEKVLE